MLLTGDQLLAQVMVTPLCGHLSLHELPGPQKLLLPSWPSHQGQFCCHLSFVVELPQSVCEEAKDIEEENVLTCSYLLWLICYKEIIL